MYTITIFTIYNPTMDKTNVMRILQQKKIEFKEYFYWDTNATNWVEIARILNEDENIVFKTLVTIWKSWQHYVFMVPVAKELDLKKCANVVNEKYIEMIPQKELLPLTWYIHWGCSPIGMKKIFPTIIHSSAENLESIIFSGWKVWYQVELQVSDLPKVVNFKFADIIKEN